LVDALVGALSREDRGDEELVGVRKMELGVGARMLRVEFLENPACVSRTLARRRRGFRRGPLRHALIVSPRANDEGARARREQATRYDEWRVCGWSLAGERRSRAR